MMGPTRVTDYSPSRPLGTTECRFIHSLQLHLSFPISLSSSLSKATVWNSQLRAGNLESGESLFLGFLVVKGFDNINTVCHELNLILFLKSIYIDFKLKCLGIELL